MSTDVDTLIEMGFSRNKAERALSKTNFRGAQVAMDWLFAHENDPDIDAPFEAPKGNVLGETSTPAQDESAATPMETDGGGEQPGQAAADGEGGAAAEAKSLKCDDCGKIMRNIDEAEFHAAKSGHSNFSESTEEKKPLTAEEKTAQLEKIQDRIKQRRQEKAEVEKQEQISKEKMRRVHGKELADVKQKMQDDEMKKLMAERKREKEDEKRAKQRVKEQIERDKRDRAAKFPSRAGGGQVEPPGASAAAASPTAAAQSPPTPVSAPSPQKEYTETKIQIRLPNGQALPAQNFGCKEPLSAVRLFIEMKRGDGEGPFSMMTTFPRKVFTQDDMEKPLTELGLVPSAVIIVQQSKA